MTAGCVETTPETDFDTLTPRPRRRRPEQGDHQGDDQVLADDDGDAPDHDHHPDDHYDVDRSDHDHDAAAGHRRRLGGVGPGSRSREGQSAPEEAEVEEVEVEQRQVEAGEMMEAGTISRRYEILDRLGSGGMSNVYRATDLILERTVAVKILAEHLSDDDRFVARFRREALSVAKLIHPNIVQVYDHGVDEGRHYIVMEYVEGRSGAQLLQRHGPLEARTTVGIGIQACAGLDYAHKRGIIHRDVKPGNLMIDGGPAGGGAMVVKLTDFGIARAAEQTRITQVGSVVGTAAYLAPGAGPRRGGDAGHGRLRAGGRPLSVPHRAASL